MFHNNVIIFIFLCIINTANALIEDQELRPQFHFLPSSNWINDPNGPFYDESTSLFHLMYQYQTPRQWGHAVSTNLIDWEILDIALNYSDAWYTEVTPSSKGVYSGSASKIFNSYNNINDIWLSVSTPTNDMVSIYLRIYLSNEP
jgi:sucrose-6-phosphate hydrolase SacC (GH32 family)